jgi:N-acetyl-gamma-glutamyl-phosphate reductase
MKSVVLGASGYSGVELLRILATHGDIDVVAAGATSHAGQRISSLFPSLYPFSGEVEFISSDILIEDIVSGDLEVDVVFLALPHGISQTVVPRLYQKVGLIVDLAADFRLKDESLYPKWYGSTHSASDFLSKAVYGLPEINRDQLKGAKLIASAGCYVTCSTLPLFPLVTQDLIIRGSTIIDAASGVTGAGRSLKENLLFCEIDEDFSVYGLKNHRHTPEIEQNLGCQVQFTPHLLPTNRGILATTYSTPSEKFEGSLSAAADPEAIGSELLIAALTEAYGDEPFVFVTPDPPSIKATLGSNNAMVWATYDHRTRRIITVSALDNLVKGAAGQAIQCANIALGLNEQEGLVSFGLYP